MSSEVRVFESGATRGSDEYKLQIRRFLDPRVLREFCLYMHRHRYQLDGSLRDPDNWKKGIPLDSYMDSLARHFWDVWINHDLKNYTSSAMVDALCGVMFNAMGYMYELLRIKDRTGTE